MAENKQTSAGWSVPYPLAIIAWVVMAVVLRAKLGDGGALLAIFGGLALVAAVIVAIALPRLALIVVVAAALIGLLVRLL